MSFSLAYSFYVENPYSISKPHLHLCLQTQMRKPIICGRRKRWSSLFGSTKSRKLMLESAYLIASTLKIIPEPLDLMIRGYADGNGGGGGRGGGGGGGSGFWRGWFEGWGRKKKRKWKFWGVLVILVIFGVGLAILGKELEIDVFWGALGLTLFGVSVNGWWMSGFRDWALGFCCCAVLLAWALKRDELQRWARGIGPLKKKRKKMGFL